ncbi:MAG: hypothetical protein RLP09_40125 [Sandaracinaceae bacterium]
MANRAPLRIRASAESLIDVRGSGGQSGGGGGGAGGAVLLEAPEVELAGRIVANGGGGGSCSARGSLGSSEVARAPGAEGCGGRGGAGGGADAVDGGDAIDGTEGAGGGGAAGSVRARSGPAKASRSGACPDLGDMVRAGEDCGSQPSPTRSPAAADGEQRE